MFGFYDPDAGGTQYRCRRPGAGTANATAEVTKLIQAGYAAKGPKESPSTYAKFPVELTAAVPSYPTTIPTRTGVTFRPGRTGP